MTQWKLRIESEHAECDQLVGHIKQHFPAMNCLGVQLFCPATGDQIQRARDEYCDDSCDLAVDDDVGTSEADGGTWVQAWVWLPDQKQDAEAPDEHDAVGNGEMS